MIKGFNSDPSCFLLLVFLSCLGLTIAFVPAALPCNTRIHRSQLAPCFPQQSGWEKHSNIGGRLLETTFQHPGALKLKAVGLSQYTDPSSRSVGVPFQWRSEWYPIAPVIDLKRDEPNKLVLLGIDLAVWLHKPSGQWRAFADLCPHRLAPLSEGRVEANGMLQCAYHGWEFGKDGECTRIPQLGQGIAETSPAVKSARACATSFPVQVAQGLVWVFPTADATAAAAKKPALIPQLDEPEFVDATNFFVRDLPYSFEVLVENLCDPAHIPFAHHSLMNGANRMTAADLNMKVTAETPQGFEARKDPYPEGKGRYDFSFQAPCLLYYQIVADSKVRGKGSFLGLGQYCVPTAPGRCRLLARFPFRLQFKPAMEIMRRTPRWMTHLSQNAVMDSDVVFLASIDEILLREKDKKMPRYYMPAGCDNMVTAFRCWLVEHGGGGPEWLGYPAERTAGEPTGWIRPLRVPRREGRDALLDRYRQHTDSCSSCREAHKALYGVRQVSLYIGVCLIAAAAAGLGKILALWGVALVVLPKVLVTHVIARLECAPWPRKQWKKPTPHALLATRNSQSLTKSFAGQ